MPSGVYIRTEECNKAHRVKRPGSGTYERKPEHLVRLIAMGYKQGQKMAHTPEHREKIRIALTGGNNPLFGKLWSEERKAKLKLSKKPFHHAFETIIKLSGSNSHLWKGGITSNMKEYCKNYYAKNIETMRIKSKIAGHNRRTKGGRITKTMLQELYEENIKYYKTLTCYLCKKPIEFGKDSIEHKIPISRGGTNEYKNLDIAHSSCNKKKYNKTETEYKGGLNATLC